MNTSTFVAPDGQGLYCEFGRKDEHPGTAALPSRTASGLRLASARGVRVRPRRSVAILGGLGRSSWLRQRPLRAPYRHRTLRSSRCSVKWPPLSRPKSCHPSLHREDKSVILFRVILSRLVPGHSFSPRTAFSPAEVVRGQKECLLIPPTADLLGKPPQAFGSPAIDAAGLRCRRQSTAPARSPTGARPRNDADTPPRT